VAFPEMVQQRKLNTLVDRTYQLAEAAEALRVIEDREVFGKIVVTP
jgi:alcohol dehydrogenase